MFEVELNYSGGIVNYPMFISSQTGRIGLGTTTPNAKFYIAKSGEFLMTRADFTNILWVRSNGKL